MLAIWGAVLSSALAVWDVYKWRTSSRPRLSIFASGNMQQVGSPDKRVFVMVKVTNTGDKATTLNILALKYYATKPRRFGRSIPTKEGIFQPNTPTPFPYKLEVGSEWTGLVEETEELKEWARNGFVYFYIVDSWTKKPKQYAKTRFVLKPYE